MILTELKKIVDNLYEQGYGIYDVNIEIRDETIGKDPSCEIDRVCVSSDVSSYGQIRIHPLRQLIYKPELEQCEKCGNYISSNDKFCSHCGADILKMKAKKIRGGATAKVATTYSNIWKVFKNIRRRKKYDRFKHHKNGTFGFRRNVVRSYVSRHTRLRKTQ